MDEEGRWILRAVSQTSWYSPQELWEATVAFKKQSLSTFSKLFTNTKGQILKGLTTAQRHLRRRKS